MRVSLVFCVFESEMGCAGISLGVEVESYVFERKIFGENSWIFFMYDGL